MLGKGAIYVASVVIVSGGASADVINGTLEETFACPGSNCSTDCTGPGGSLLINGSKELSAWTIS